MYFQFTKGRAAGLLLLSLALTGYSFALFASDKTGSNRRAKVAAEYKSASVGNFSLADYQEELLECTALATLQMWVGDGSDGGEGSQVRKTISENYWLEIGNGYLSLAKEASGKQDLSEEVHEQIVALTSEWRRLTDNNANDAEWSKWNALIERCETWRPEGSTYTYYSRGG